MARISLITGSKGLTERSATDFYHTPTVSTNSLFDSGYLELGKIQTVLEPACGKRHISKVVSKYLPKAFVESSDLYKYTNDSLIKTNIDFLKQDYTTKYDMVITNPPYNSKVLIPFVEKALNVSNRYVCMFLKITFLESTKRYKFFKKHKHLKYILAFSNRQPMYKDGIKTNVSNAIMYAWFIWDKTYIGLPTIDWLNNTKEIKASISY